MPPAAHAGGRRWDRRRELPGARSVFGALPVCQGAAQVAATAEGLVVGRFVDDQAAFVVEHSAVLFAAGGPLFHPLAAAPAVRAEQRDIFAAVADLQPGTH